MHVRHVLLEFTIPSVFMASETVASVRPRVTVITYAFVKKTIVKFCPDALTSCEFSHFGAESVLEIRTVDAQFTAMASNQPGALPVSSRYSGAEPLHANGIIEGRSRKPLRRPILPVSAKNQLISLSRPAAFEIMQRLNSSRETRNPTD